MATIDLMKQVSHRLPHVAADAAAIPTLHSATPARSIALVEANAKLAPFDFVPPFDSRLLWSRAAADGTRAYSPERLQLHNAIVDSVLAAADAQRAGINKATPTATFMMGAPGAGKSTLIQRLQSDGNTAVVVETDMLKSGMPEYNAMVTARLGHAADFVQQESRDVADLLRDRVLKRRMDMIVDRSGGSSRYLDAVRSVREQGYRTEVVGAFTDDVKTLIARADERFRRTGRRVPPEAIHRDVPKVARNALNFLEDRSQVDSIRLFDNSTTGAPPRVFAERTGDGPAVVHDRAMFERLLQYAGRQ